MYKQPNYMQMLGSFAPVPNPAEDATAPLPWIQRLGQWGKTSGFAGSTDTKTGIKTDGWGGLALGGAQALMGGYLGMKQYGMAKSQLAEAKRQFNVNYEAQRKSMNTAMEGRAAARHASNPDHYESAGAYMDKHRI